MALQQPGTELMSVSSVLTKDCVDTCQYETMLVMEGLAAGAKLIWVACAATRAMMASGLQLLSRAMSGSVFLLHLGSMLMSLAHVTTVGNRNYAC